MYSELYELWKKEKEHETELQRLPANFQSKITDYIKKLKAESRMLDKKSTKAKLMDNELNYVKNMVDELFGMRYKKLREKVFAREPVVQDVLSKEEKKLYEDVLPFADAYHTFSKDILRGHLLPLKEDVKQEKICVLRFVQEIPALVGADMKTYGPFVPEDVATLPLENARILVKQGMAVKIDSK